MSCKQQTFNVVVLFSVVLFARYGRSEDTPSTCKTPKDESGICVQLNGCPALKDLLLPGIRSDENIFYIQNSTCKAAVKRKLMFCCPASTVARPDTTANVPTPKLVDVRSGPTGTGVFSHDSSEEEIEEKPLDVSKSLRLNMLPLRVCGYSLDGKVIGGHMSEVGQFPWMALLMYETPSSQANPFCGGSLINSRYVLTAAHCVSERDRWGLGSTDPIYNNIRANLKVSESTVKISVKRSLVARLGELHTSNETDCTGMESSRICAPPVEEYSVEDVILHPNFSSPSRYLNDIALLRLNETVIFKDHIVPICLPIGKEQTRNLLKEKPKLYVAGWGTTENGTYSPHLLFGTVPVVSEEKCVESYRHSKVMSRISSSRQLCAGGLESDSCYGDSGGPLSFFGEVDGGTEIVQYGIVSFGPLGCAIRDKPAVYTRVGFYMDWILNTLRP